MLNQNEIGAKIAVARKLKNLSQAQLAEWVAVSAQAVGKWERGESMPDIISFARLAGVLGTDVNYFVGAGADPSQKETAAMCGAADEGSSNANNSCPWGNMSGGNWTNADFTGLFGLPQRFSGSNINKCLFVESELAGLTFRGDNIQKSDFSRSDLRRCSFRSSNLQHSIFAGCDFTGSEFNKSNMADCDLSGANLTEVHIKWSNLKKLNLTGATLCRTVFQLGQLTKITFSGTLTACSFDCCDFSSVVFDGATLINCFFKNAKLNKISKRKRTKFIACRADQLTYTFLKICKADLADVTIIESGEAKADH
ncbi:MAG: pentapeptide repeat-containing protein [Oscillospiraceae bacterium]|jgi:uncharacterized protein YjbI with pentapeptide repeats/DNA-binding XRE family transcriptional regulator|nr:pentapeptide repeat-containing protein [Oscillospiraceae bacterium]